MQEIAEKLTERAHMIDAELKKVKKILKQAPPGRLRITHGSRGTEYHLIEDGRERYLRKEAREDVRLLAEKAYCLRLERVLEKERKIIRDFLNGFDPEAGKRIFEKMAPDRQKLVDPIEIPDALFRHEWLGRYETNAAEDPNSIPVQNGFSTEHGEIVRSKSEQIIADKLFYRNIPYVYEAPLVIGNQKFYPDFTVLNVRTRKTYYLEHFGRMDDPSYTERVTRKLALYEAAGIWPGEQLLMTFETAAQPFNTRLLDELIRKYFR